MQIKEGRNPQTGAVTTAISSVVKTIKGALKPSQEIKENETEASSDLVAVRFLKSPTGLYNLAYSPGQNGHVTEAQADELVEEGYAELI